MSKYFELDYPGRFQQFTAPHLTVLALVALICILIFIFREKIKQTDISPTVHIIMALALILCELTLHLWYIYTGIWSVKRSLPLHLCGASVYICAYMLLTNDKRIYEIAFFWGVGGALQALITPNTDYPFPHYVFFEFFTAHSLIVMSCLWVTFIDGYRLTFKSVWKALLALDLYAVFVAAVNYFTGGNYLFISRKPSTPSLLDYLGPWPWYLISLEAVAVAIFLILYLPFAISDRINADKFRKETISSGPVSVPKEQIAARK